MGAPNSLKDEVKNKIIKMNKIIQKRLNHATEMRNGNNEVEKGIDK